ncbi:hypothetical protein [Parvicella tangerina]|uniref:hypothetical protein n=1 Tax=Parvicella tangerina TaxID=2829795 RepID=UPI00215C249F|nr:hypothetical protein [Parvicella tangerina]
MNLSGISQLSFFGEMGGVRLRESSLNNGRMYDSQEFSFSPLLASPGLGLRLCSEENVKMSSKLNFLQYSEGYKRETLKHYDGNSILYSDYEYHNYYMQSNNFHQWIQFSNSLELSGDKNRFNFSIGFHGIFQLKSIKQAYYRDEILDSTTWNVVYVDEYYYKNIEAKTKYFFWGFNFGFSYRFLDKEIYYMSIGYDYSIADVRIWGDYTMDSWHTLYFQFGLKNTTEQESKSDLDKFRLRNTVGAYLYDEGVGVGGDVGMMYSVLPNLSFGVSPQFVSLFTSNVRYTAPLFGVSGFINYSPTKIFDLEAGFGKYFCDFPLEKEFFPRIRGTVSIPTNKFRFGIYVQYENWKPGLGFAWQLSE